MGLLRRPNGSDHIGTAGYGFGAGTIAIESFFLPEIAPYLDGAFSFGFRVSPGPLDLTSVRVFANTLAGGPFLATER